MGILLVIVVLATVLLVVTPRKMPDLQPPWCGATKDGYYRCHEPAGHMGPHVCDDLTGEVTWTDP